MRKLYIFFLFLGLVCSIRAERELSIAAGDLLPVLPESDGKSIFVGWIHFKGGHYNLVMGTLIPFDQLKQSAQAALFSSSGSMKINVSRTDGLGDDILYKVLVNSADGKVSFDSSSVQGLRAISEPLILAKTSRDRVVLLDADELSAREASFIVVYAYLKDKVSVPQIDPFKK